MVWIFRVASVWRGRVEGDAQADLDVPAGHLGRLVIDALLERGAPAGQVVAVVRDTGKAGDLADRGVRVRHGDYDQPDTLATAMAGTDRVLLVSGSELGQRVEQHRAVVDAAAPPRRTRKASA